MVLVLIRKTSDVNSSAKPPARREAGVPNASAGDTSGGNQLSLTPAQVVLAVGAVVVTEGLMLLGQYGVGLQRDSSTPWVTV